MFGGALDERAVGVRDAFLQVLDGLGNAILRRVDRALGIAGGQRFDGGGAAFLHIGGGVLNAFLQRFGGGGGLYLSSRFLGGGLFLLGAAGHGQRRRAEDHGKTSNFFLVVPPNKYPYDNAFFGREQYTGKGLCLMA